MKKAIVFAGGGSKGAYQIGIWKALNELGETFDIATGTSIGSINAAFYVQHDFDAAYEMWKQITAADIITDGINLEKNFGSMFGQRDQIMHLLKGYISSKGVDVTPFHNCIKHYFNAEKFASSDVDFALITVCFTDRLEPREVKKQEITDRGEDGWEWIAASAAAFPVFPMMKVDGKNYIDGGWYDNIPVASAIRLGAQKVTVVDLKPDHSHEGYAHHPYVTYIRPTRDLGTFLNFDRHVLDRSIKLGYNDAMKEYRRYFGRLFTYIPGAEGADYYKTLGEKFTEILTVTEAGFSYQDSVRLHRIDSVEGCSPLLWENSYHNRMDFRSLFFSALEIYMHLLGFDDTKDYKLDELIPALKASLAMENTAEEFNDENGFPVFEKYLRSEYDENLSSVQDFIENDRIKLIAIAMARTLLLM